MREKVNITNLKKVAKGELALDDLSLGIKKSVSYYELISIPSYIADVCIDDNEMYIDNNTRHLFTRIYIAILMSNYDGKTIIDTELDDDTIDKVIDVYDVIHESGLIDRIYNESKLGFETFDNAVIQACSDKINFEKIIGATATLQSMNTYIDDETTKLKELIDSEDFQAIADKMKEADELKIETINELSGE